MKSFFEFLFSYAGGLLAGVGFLIMLYAFVLLINIFM